MRIIDERGRLFGKINIIDFLVILILLCILPAFYFGYKILTKGPEVAKREFIEIETNCQLIKLRLETLKAISIGDKELDENGEMKGEIISLGQSMPYKYELDIGEEKKMIKEDKELKQVEAKLKLKAEIKGDKIYYKDKLIKIGLPLDFKTNKYNIVIAPFTVKKEEAEEIIVKLKIKFKNIIPEIPKIIKPGDKQIQVVKDGDKWVIAKITKVISNEPSEILTLISGEKWDIKGHPKYRNLVLEIESLCVRRPQGLFLRSKPVKVGKPFEFSAELYSIMGTIIEIEPK